MCGFVRIWAVKMLKFTHFIVEMMRFGDELGSKMCGALGGQCTPQRKGRWPVTNALFSGSEFLIGYTWIESNYSSVAQVRHAASASADASTL